MSSAALKDLVKEVFHKNIINSRNATGKSIQDFKFKKDRCRLLSKYEELREDSKGVIYWMCRESRVQDNWALLYAQKLSLKFNVPLHVCFFLDEFKELYPTTRQVGFLRKGLKLVEKELDKLNISFNLIKSSPVELVKIVKENNIGCIVCDFFPLKIVERWHEELLEKLPKNVALLQVDAHNIVPCWIVSDKCEKAARSIRPKITKHLPVYLTNFPAVCKQEKKEELIIDQKLEWSDNNKLNIENIEEITWAEPGEAAGFEMMRTFLLNRLQYYGISSNDPSKKHQSNLSPWFHFGQVSAQRVALEVAKLKEKWRTQCERFLEEAIIRKEISDNFTFYQSNYDNFNCAENWARDTLNLHRSDKREYLYTLEQFEKGLTHDPIWNSAQIQLVTEGKLQGYMRMYWCKKILEWTKSPEQAIEFALSFNDRYSIDGSDPNGFVGVMWSICGVHDQGFKERPVFGKIRWMAGYCLSKKFDVTTYCAKYRPTAKISGSIDKFIGKKAKDEKPDKSEEKEKSPKEKRTKKKTQDDEDEPVKKKKKT